MELAKTTTPAQIARPDCGRTCACLLLQREDHIRNRYWLDHVPAYSDFADSQPDTDLQHLVDRCPGSRSCRPRDLRRPHASSDRRYHARHRSLQPCPRSHRNDAGIGASLSGLVAGEIVDHFGYSPTFLILGGAALVALTVFAIQMPETVEQRRLPTEKALSRS